MDFYCINLQKRFDRKDSIIKQFGEQNISVEFFNGLDAKQLNIHSKLRTKGMVGCFISHHMLHLKLQSKNTKWSAIIEDDLIICKNLLYYLHSWIKTAPEDADILFFGYHRRPESKTINISPDWLSIDKFYGAHFYLVKTESLCKIISLTSVIENEIDVQIVKYIQKGDLIGYCSVVPLGRQSGSETNVQKP